MSENENSSEQQNVDNMQDAVQSELEKAEADTAAKIPTTIEETKNETAASVVSEKVSTVKPTAVVDIDAALADLKVNGSVKEKGLINALETYVKRMSPGVPVNPDNGARFQYEFWSTIQDILENSLDNEFKKLWNILLAFVNKYKTSAFDDKYVYRFSEKWMWNLDFLTAFQNLLNLIKLTADANNRQVNVKKVSMGKTLSIGLSEKAKNRVINFYSR